MQLNFGEFKRFEIKQNYGENLTRTQFITVDYGDFSKHVRDMSVHSTLNIFSPFDEYKSSWATPDATKALQSAKKWKQYKVKYFRKFNFDIMRFAKCIWLVLAAQWAIEASLCIQVQDQCHRTYFFFHHRVVFSSGFCFGFFLFSTFLFSFCRISVAASRSTRKKINRKKRSFFRWRKKFAATHFNHVVISRSADWNIYENIKNFIFV